MDSARDGCQVGLASLSWPGGGADLPDPGSSHRGSSAASTVQKTKAAWRSSKDSPAQHRYPKPGMLHKPYNH